MFQRLNRDFNVIKYLPNTTNISAHGTKKGGKDSWTSPEVQKRRSYPRECTPGKNQEPGCRTARNQGFHTNYGGAFLLLPYLAALDLDKLVCNLGIENQQGIATLQNVLSLVFLAVAGKNISAI